jgi:tetratricopeptide (TPR) repeat protein
MNSVKNKLLFFFLIIFTCPLFSQPINQTWWFSLEQGKVKLRSGDYGSALLLFEDARRQRKAMYEQMERDLINLLSNFEVRRIGDSLDKVEQYSYDRFYTRASAALEELYYRVPKDSLENSAASALAALGGLKDYPEAEYWIGEIYRIEGELSLALAQYRKAYLLRSLSEDSGFGTQMQHKIASILLIRQEYNEMENVLLSIINDLDSLWTNAGKVNSGTTGTERVPFTQASAVFASKAMTQTLEKEGINRFMELYRYDNSLVEEAHRALGLFYAVSGRPSAQQHLMFTFLIQNTVIINEVMRRQFDFIFTDLLKLAQETNKYAVIKSYIDEVEYYKTAYYLADSLFRSGKLSAARDFWNFLASQPQSGEWHNRALRQLQNPKLEPVVYMP